MFYRLWESTNRYGTGARYVDNLQSQLLIEGACAGMSSLWCQAMLQNVKVEIYRPDIIRAMILQQSYSWYKNYKLLFHNLDVAIGAEKNFPHERLGCNYMLDEEGTFYVSLFGHGIGVKITDRFCYYFDPNLGCFGFVEDAALPSLFQYTRSVIDVDLGTAIKVFKLKRQ